MLTKRNLAHINKEISKEKVSLQIQELHTFLMCLLVCMFLTMKAWMTQRNSKMYKTDIMAFAQAFKAGLVSYLF